MAKFLLIRFSSIGDIILTTPIIRAIKQQIPDAEVHFLTKKNFVGLIKHNPYVSKVFEYDNSLSSLLPDLKKENYSHVLDLHKNLRSAQVVISLKKPSSNFDKLNIEKWLAVNLKVNKLPNTHLVDRYFKAFASLGIQNDNQGLNYFPNPSTNIPQLPPSFSSNFMVWAIGGTHFTKRLPPESIRSTLEKITYPCILLGGKEDETTGESIAKGLPHVLNLSGLTSIDESALLIKASKLVVSNDTGMMHIAAAFRKKTISIWGNTIPEFGMFSYQDPSNVINMENSDIKCRPCSKLGFSNCPQKHFQCMKNLSIDALISNINSFWN